MAAAEPIPRPAQELPPMGAYANQFLRGQIAAIQAGIPSFPNATRAFIKTLPDSLYEDGVKDVGGEFTIGIVGAGCAGLFTAMILNYLNSIPALKDAGLNLKYEILEANKSERVGGRLYTYKFKEKDKKYPIGPHEYYDVGGMRFPENATMKKTFQLFELLGMTSGYKEGEEWKKWKKDFDSATPDEQDKLIFQQPSVADVKPGQLIPYYMSGVNCPMIYNGVQAVKPEGKDFMSAKDFKIDGLPGRVVTADPNAMVDDFVEEYRIKYHEDGPKAFWDLLQEKGDAYSVRQYLTNWARYDYNTIEFLETMNFGNRWYDQAFSEMVVDSMEFDFALAGERVFWWCVMGGAQELPRTMAQGPFPPPPPEPTQSTSSNDTASETANRQALARGRQSLKALEVNYEKKVTKIEYNWPADWNERKKCVTPEVQVTYQDVSTQEKPSASKTYDAVFNSTAMGVQQHMSLEGLNLNWGTKQAIRSLGYGASSKVGIRFKSLWWMDPKNGLNLGINKGGVGHTDENIGFCVYPSYNVDDKPEQPGVLLASYNWSQMAQRLSSLIDRKSPENEDSLREVLLDDLARLHASQSTDPTERPDIASYPDPKDWPKIFQDRYQKMYDFLQDQYLDHYAWDWYHDEQSVGAFAFFGPGQFKNMYPWIIRSNGTYLMIGEAASSNHAWVVGALDSAVRAVYQFLWVRSRNSKACSEAAKLFVREPVPGTEGCELSSLFMELPPEFNRTDDVKDDGTTKRSSPIGEYLRQGVFAECCRLLQNQDQLASAKVTEKLIKTVMPTVSTGTQTVSRGV